MCICKNPSLVNTDSIYMKLFLKSYYNKTNTFFFARNYTDHRVKNTQDEINLTSEKNYTVYIDKKDFQAISPF